jgi:hypothetical protein
MKSTLFLTVTGEYVDLEASQPQVSNSIHSRLYRYARKQSVPNLVDRQDQADRARVLWENDASTFEDALEQAWGDLTRKKPNVYEHCKLTVQLGLTHTRIGLLVLGDSGSTSISPSSCDVYASAWVKQMCNVDPLTQVIRWSFLPNAKHLLISCVDSQIFKALEVFSTRSQVKFVSCKPALITAISEYGQKLKSMKNFATSAATLVWTETSLKAPRMSVVQLIRYEYGQPSAVWRGWLTCPKLSDGADNALKGAIRRFQAHNRALPGELIHQHHWPERARQLEDLETAV